MINGGEFIDVHPILQTLTEEQKEVFRSAIEFLEMPAGRVLLHEGMQQSDLYWLVEGMAKNTFASEEGEEVTVLFYHPGELIGLVSAISHRRTKFAIQTIADSRLYRIPHLLFEQLLQENYLFADKIMRVISQRFDTLYQEIQQEHSLFATGMEMYPYRKKIGEIMTTPVITAFESDALMTITQKMHVNRISSIVITNTNGSVSGIVTRDDIIRMIATDSQAYSTYQAKDIMSSSLFTLPPEAYYYEALLVMAKHQIEHIPIVSQTDQLEGMITLRNLTEARGSNLLGVIERIDSAQTVQELTGNRDSVYHIMESMVKDNATAHEICHLITECNDRLTRRIIAMSEHALREEGMGDPPAGYCWLTMGSEGRREQTLGTDQDNALIYVDVEPDQQEKVDQYFARLAEKVVATLESCGFPRCKGNVMATNPRWRHSLSDWKRGVHQWLELLEGEELRSFTIFLDFRPVYGQFSLAEEVRTFLFEMCKDDRFLLQRLAEDDAEYQVPLGVFGRIVSGRENDHPDEVNIKHGGVMHIVNAMRIFALREGVQAVSTLERLEALSQMELFSQEDAESIKQAYNTLTMLRIRQNLKQIKEGKEPTYYLNVKSLGKREYIRLKKSLSTAKWLQQLVAYRLGGRL